MASSSFIKQTDGSSSEKTLPQLLAEAMTMTDEHARRILWAKLSKRRVRYQPLLTRRTFEGVLIEAGPTGRGVMARWDDGTVTNVPFPSRLEFIDD